MDTTIKVTSSKLLVLYLILSMGFIALSFTTLLPSIFLDELIYSKFAESLWNNHTLLFRGNDFHFNNLAYSVLISPFYGLPSKEYIFVAIKIFNSLSFCLTLFPVYFFAQKVLNDERKSLLVGILTVLSSGYFTSHLMIENIFYPLFWGIVYCLYCIFSEQKKKYQVIFVILSLIAIFTKPTIIPVFIIFCLMIIKEIVYVLKTRSPIANIFFKYYISMIGILIVFVTYILITTQTYEAFVNRSSFDFFIFFQSFISNMSFLGLFCFSLPLVLYSINLFRSKEQLTSNYNIFTIVLILGVIIIIAYADVVTRDFRIHERYFLILYPIMFISFFIPLKKIPQKTAIYSSIIILLIMSCSFLLLPKNKYLIIPDAPNFAIISLLGRYISIFFIKICLVILSFIFVYFGIFYNKVKIRYILLSVSFLYFCSNLFINNIEQFLNSKNYQLTQYNAIRAVSSQSQITKNDNVLFVYNGGDTKLLWNSEFLINGKHNVASFDPKIIPDGWDNKIIRLNNHGEIINDNFKNINYIVSYGDNIKFEGEVVASSRDIFVTKISGQKLYLKSKDDGHFSDGWLGETYKYVAYSEKKEVSVSIGINGVSIPDGVGSLSGVIKSKQLSKDFEFTIKPKEKKLINLDLIKQDSDQPFELVIENQTFIPDFYYKNGDKRKLSVILENIAVNEIKK
jgi:hypothetical protein